MRVLITGGCGFIGTAVVDVMLRRGCQVLNLDKMTYAANPQALAEWTGSARYEIAQGDVCDMGLVLSLFEEFQPDRIIHCAAETHVDRSIDSAAQFLQTNFVGTFTILEAARHWWAGRRGDHRFHMISTDEVYGAVTPGSPGTAEERPFAPASPYAASKAAACHLVHAWGQTYQLPAVTTYCSNNYGPWQFPEKLVPLVITRGSEREDVPMYGTGEALRDWVHVADHAEAVYTVLEHGKTGESYNIGGSNERSTAEVVRLICEELDRRMPAQAPHDRMVRHVDTRPGDAARFAMDTTKIWRELRWRPEIDFRDGLARTVDWYLDNRDWWQEIRNAGNTDARPGRDAA